MRSTSWQLRAADVAGRTLRAAGRTSPGVTGALLVAVGLGLAWLPLGLIAAGGFLLVLHWELSNVPAKAKPVKFADGRDRPYLRSVA